MGFVNVWYAFFQVLYLPNREEKVELLKHLAFGKEAGPALLTKVDKVVGEEHPFPSLSLVEVLDFRCCLEYT